MEENRSGRCGSRCGWLPGCAPLALAYVPMQQNALERYDPKEALARGTLFPGLDLPFMDMVNTPPEVCTPMRELMALDFVVHELILYLDTHGNDEEAFACLQTYMELAREGRKRYTELYGPIQTADLLGMKKYTWLENPWPWDVSEGRRTR